MQSILNDERVRTAGAFDCTRSASGITPRRVPLRVVQQIADASFGFVSSNASGVRLALSTDSDVVELDVMLTGIEFPGGTQPEPCFDLVIDGKLVSGHKTRSGGVWVLPPIGSGSTEATFRPGDPETVVFANLAPAMKRVEIWLPQNRVVELRGLRVANGARVEASPREGARWIHYGSSISHCSEADRPTNAWPATAARIAGVDLTSLGFGGQAQLDQPVARTIRDLPADVISLKIGVNVVNADSLRERTFVPALHGFLDTIRDGHPETPLLVITPIIFPACEDHPGPTTLFDGQAGVVKRPNSLAIGALSIGRIRELIETVVTGRQNDGDLNLHFLDGRALFGVDDVADLPDGLHPNTAGYVRMGQRFAHVAFGEHGPFARHNVKAGVNPLAT